MTSDGGDLMSLMDTTASGMQAQVGAMNVYAHNMALAQTATPEKPAYGYEPTFAMGGGDGPGDPADAFAALVSAKSGGSGGDDDGDENDDDDGGNVAGVMGGIPAGQVAMTGVRRSATPVDTISQMVAMMNAQRMYESESSMFDEGKSIAQKAIQMGQS